MIIKEGLSRSRIIDEIDEFYNSDTDDWRFIEDSLEKVSGIPVQNTDEDDPDEGFYSSYTTEQLQQVLDMLNKMYTGDFIIKNLTNTEWRLIRSAMEMFSDASFSRSFEDAATAKRILKKMEES